ncbi:hypothetical protein Ancab_038061 [Ancistrocladus abbreviatus]
MSRGIALLFSPSTIIVADDFHHQLVISKKFAGNIWAELPARVPLKCPSGAQWDAESMASGDLMFLLNGLEEFVKACLLKEKDILILECDGNSCFVVLMFDGKFFVRKKLLISSGNVDI